MKEHTTAAEGKAKIASAIGEWVIAQMCIVFHCCATSSGYLV